MDSSRVVPAIIIVGILVICGLIGTVLVNVNDQQETGDPLYAVSVNYDDDIIGCTGTGDYSEGSSVILKATPIAGDVIYGWFDKDGNKVSSEETYSITDLKEDVQLYVISIDEFDGDRTFHTPSNYVDGHEIWTITNVYTRKVVAVLEGADVEYTFEEPGYYQGVMKNDTQTFTQSYRINGEVKRLFVWEYGTSDYGVIWSTTFEKYEEIYNSKSIEERRLTTNENTTGFVTYTDDDIVDLTSFLERKSIGMTQQQRANFVLDFVQKIEYIADETTTGYTEYWKLPYETLFDKCGDCEDTSILYASIMKAMGYDVALMIFPGHMAVGIGLENGTGVKNRYDGVDYYYCETTSEGWEVGEKPDKYTDVKMVVI
ncbi:MAG: hypothetical protein WCR24_02955 [Candidatus Methanomethylophilaceae archaeon]